MRMSSNGIAMLKHFEGVRLNAYKDVAGVWTIGYGSIKDVKEGMAITMVEAERRLRMDLVEKERAVERLVKKHVGQMQFDALVDFAFNLGEGALGGSTLLKKIHADEDPSNEWLRWVLAGGRAQPGLVLRRMAERLMYNNKDWSYII